MTDLREQVMQNRIDALANEKQNLKEEKQYLKEQIAQLKKMTFGSKTPKTKRVFDNNKGINLRDYEKISVNKILSKE